MKGVYQYQGEASNAVEADYNRGLSTGLSNVGGITADMIPGLMTRAQPRGGSVEVDYNAPAPVVPITQKTINTTGDFSPEYINLMTTLGVTPDKMATLTGSGYGYDSQAASDAGLRSGENLNTQFTNLLRGGTQTSIQGDQGGVQMFKIVTPSGETIWKTVNPDGSTDYRRG